jgi:hypothetical protein
MSEEQQNGTPSAAATGGSQVGVVQRPGAQPAQPEPVLEHRVEMPQEPQADPVSHVAEAQPQETVPVTAEAPEPAPPLQESPQVSMPVRMSQLQTENKRLRDEMDALERSLKKTLR